MSAPVREPRVYVSADPWATRPARWTAWCPWCCREVAEHRHTWSMAIEDALDHYCAGVQLTSLKATLRALITRWCTAAAGLETEAMNRAIAGRIETLTCCADELERAIGGGING